LSKNIKILVACGARPNFMKIAPFLRGVKNRDGIECRVFYSNQHYASELSSVFFRDLEIRPPFYFMSPTKGTHAEQTAKTMIDFEYTCIDFRPDLVVVVGDVNTTLACTISAKKLNIAVAHIEAGLRSFDMTMPEEINRRITDSVADLLFCTEKNAIRNLQEENRSGFLVGNIMIDNLFFQLEKLNQNKGINKISEKYIFLTLHRPSNVDSKAVLQRIVDIVSEISITFAPVVFPVHPRTRLSLEKFKIKPPETVRQLNPLGFIESLKIWKDAVLVMTDSGGLQEESTALNIPCLTIRDSTERPCTVTTGTNTIVGTNKEKIIDAVKDIFNGNYKKGEIPKMWDGKTAERIIDIISAWWKI